MKFFLPFTIFYVALFFLSTTSFGQIKIGTNPTTIDSNANLEIEASTAGRKLKIDKITGQITIADGTQEYGKMLTTDADGNAKWSKIQASSLYSFSKAFMGGASTNVLEDNVAQTLNYPIPSSVSGNWKLDEFGLVVLEGGLYRIETTLEIVNSEGCYGLTSMGLAVDLVRNDVVMEGSGTDDRLTPIHTETYKYKVSILYGLLAGDRVKFSIKASIPSFYPNCTTKVVSGGMSLIYQP